MSKKSYLFLNAILALIIILIFLYSAINDPEKGSYPLPAFSKVLTGEDSISTGLSRSFSELVRFNFAAAAEYNPYGLGIFIFFTVQLFMRMLTSFLLIFEPQTKIAKLILIDSLQATISFLISFWPFFVYFFDSVGV